MADRCKQSVVAVRQHQNGLRARATAARNAAAAALEAGDADAAARGAAQEAQLRRCGAQNAISSEAIILGI